MMRVHRNGWTILCAASVLLIMSYGVVANEVFTVVSPEGFEDVEGGGSEPGVQITEPSESRHQGLHLASAFASLPPGYNRIIGMAWRPDGDVNEPITSTTEYIEIRLSTTSKTTDDLSSFFAENIGDDETLVYSGELVLSTGGSGPAGGPKSFDYIVDFDEPFIYDPTAGNLLYELRLRNPDSYWQRDLATFPPPATRRRVIGTFSAGWDAETGGVVSALPVTQFFIPEPSTFILAASSLVFACGCRRRR